ncbi:MAG TPA: efflux RND transporter permease subunit, partial [candidate division Zixibacteria bacterium]|nr:efflux RND transporter permease subunit [candidate division Zixibacteria bacterium]
PDTMASSVATPLERQFGRIAGITQMTSSSQLGSTSISLQFDLNRDIDGAARDVQAAINAARGQLPSNLPTNPGYRKVNPADAPIMIVALTSDVQTQAQMYDVADSILAQKLSQVPGVGQVFVGGSAKPAVRAEVNPTVLNKLGVGLDRVRTVLNAANANNPKGALADSNTMQMVEVDDQITRARSYRPLIVAQDKNGAILRLTDVATVVDSVEDIRNSGLANGRAAVLLVIFRQPGANIIETVDNVTRLLPQLQASIPPTIQLKTILDRTLTIRASVRDVQRTLIISISLVVLIVFLFLRNLGATIIPSIAVPLSLVGTFAAMYLLGYALDNLSLMALTISTGFVVDDAIVVIENISRHIENGMSPMAATLRGSSEIGFTVMSMSTSLVAVFIPILMMAGLVGRLFREFAVTLSVAIAVSLVVSLTTTPMMCARLLKAQHGRKHNWLYRLSESFFEGLNKFYRITLTKVLLHPAITLTVLLITIAANFYLWAVVPKGFFPQQDGGRIGGMVQGSQDISYQAMNEKVTQFQAIVRQDPAIENVMSFTGGGGAPNTARMFVTLKPLEQRKGTTPDDVINRLRRKLAVVPGASLYMQAAQDLQIGGRMGNAQYQYTLQGENLEELNEWAPKMLEALRGNKFLRDVNTDQQMKGLEQTVVIDRDTASRLGISAQQIDSALYDAFGQRQVSNIYMPLNQYHVVMEVDQRWQQSPDVLKVIYVRSTGGQMVPLSAFAHFGPSNTPLAVNHQGQFPSVTISFNLAPGAALGDAARTIEEAARNMRLPADIHPSFQGSAAAFQDSLKSEPLLIVTALFAVYIVLGILYESYVHPFTILSTLPSAGVGAILALMLLRSELNVISLIGIILLIGLVKKNGIMMIDFALAAERDEGKSPRDAIFEACMLRFRPIMMTTMAAMLGALPLAFGTGMGAELRRPLGIAIVGGLAVSQVLTLYTTPVVYLFLDRLRLWFIRRWKGQDVTPQQGPETNVLPGNA